MADNDTSKKSAYDRLDPQDRRKVDEAVQNFADLSERNKIPYDKERVRNYILEAAGHDPKKFLESVEVTVQPTSSSLPYNKKDNGLSV
jgi:ribosomal protein L1